METPISVTKTIYTVTDFISWQREGHLNLRPYFQRGDVWTPKAKSFLIDTLIRGYSVPIIYLQNKRDRETLSNVRLVVDGQQRLRTIFSFVAPEILQDYNDRDQFSILRAHNAELAGHTFHDLPDDIKDRVLETELSVHVLPPSLSDAHLLQLFARLNSTGERLNDQELRNAEFHGAFKTAAYRLSYDQLQRWQDLSIFSPRAIAQMRDVELMSELMIVTLRGIQNKTTRQINEVYRLYDDNFPEEETVSERVTETFDLIEELYRYVEPSRSVRLNTQSWFYAIYTAADYALHGRPVHWENQPDHARWLQDLAVERRPKDLPREILRVQHQLERENVPREVAKALRGASSDLGSRAARLEFLIGR